MHPLLVDRAPRDDCLLGRSGYTGMTAYSCLFCMQGAAFDVPQEIADQMMENVEELTKRGFTLDLPASLPVEEERNYGGDRRFGMRPGGSNRGGCVHRKLLAHPARFTCMVVTQTITGADLSAHKDRV